MVLKRIRQHRKKTRKRKKKNNDIVLDDCNIGVYSENS
jgi:hypothetical protein